MPKKDTTAEDTTSETVNEAEASETEKKDEKTNKPDESTLHLHWLHRMPCDRNAARRTTYRQPCPPDGYIRL